MEYSIYTVMVRHERAVTCDQWWGNKHVVEEDRIAIRLTCEHDQPVDSLEARELS
jgi:hypothetical protein